MLILLQMLCQSLGEHIKIMLGYSRLNRQVLDYLAVILLALNELRTGTQHKHIGGKPFIIILAELFKE